ncbi:hypothetical protein SNE40_022473 [Patella caerulea]|uniref:DNA-directed RNA polymerase subunit beta n=1 Tax=Patella caerulea TaxID=87958 RepID=A0AAN8G5K4_PATCE
MSFHRSKQKQPSFKNLTAPDFGVPKAEQVQLLQDVTRPHVESFNYMIQEGLRNAIKDIRPIQFSLPSEERVSISITSGIIRSPRVNQTNVAVSTQRVYPKECREKGTTYKGALQVSINCSINNKIIGQLEKIIGQVPIMVKSDACNLANLKPAELIKHGEENEEMGGYFIVNGKEKVIRMLIMQRRNYPLCLKRNGWKSRGPFYTEYGIQLRSVRNDQSGNSCILHYLSNGTAMLEFGHQKDRFFVPVVFILKALVDVSDKYIYDKMTRGYEEDTYFKGCIVNMLREVLKEKLLTQDSMLNFIGEKFRVKLNLPEWYTNKDIASFLLEKCICIHLDSNIDKFHLLVYITQKLFVFAKGKCAEESPDNPMNQEVLLSGHLLLIFLKERLESWLIAAKINIDKMSRHQGMAFTLDFRKFLTAINKVSDITNSMNYFLATGNLRSASGLNLMQQAGLSVVADKLNSFRYISHFRCVHRGAFFTEMRTTTVRKLRPEAWGFLCPVHTPDGTPCGLMNHLAAQCSIVNSTCDTSNMTNLLAKLGVIALGSSSLLLCGPDFYSVILDGKMMGYIHDDKVEDLSNTLRMLKVTQQEKVPSVLEICFVPKTKYASQFPGLYLFSTLARMIRPVINLAHDMLEMIGTFEQVYLNICVTPEEAHEGITTHEEICEHSMLSVIACLTPYSDFNQSPRNMYQCQMGKQTLGTPLHSYRYRADNKLYRLQTPQSPIVRPVAYDDYNMDEYPIGTNAVVAVISYTGYDMEDAMVINKSSFERGFGHGTVYKTEIIDLQSICQESGQSISLIFGNKDMEDNGLDIDGLPNVGRFLKKGAAYYSYINLQTGESKVVIYKNDESAYVEQIKLLGDDNGNTELQRVAIVLRIPRNPVIGDKFSSRHGQKGICSMMWPVEDMPFTETGMAPDIIFNPHGFPSRMTIGMMIESMAGKSGASHGLCHDATPFTFSEDKPAIDHFGQMLTEAGYNYYGTECLYSGIDGRELEVEIFIGIVYYQRLRHMVSDKFQVRSTGPVDVLTHQPVKGRKKAGGVRFGEMERDALIAHGTPFLLHDRLFNCSDKSYARMCTDCHSLLSPVLEKPKQVYGTVYNNQNKWTCSLCKKTESVQVIAVPYVFQVLVAEMAAMGLKVVLDVK